MRATLFLLGAGFELLGVILIAAPDLLPGAVRLSRWAARRWRPIEKRLRQTAGLSPRKRTVFGASSASFALTGASAGLVVGFSPDAPLEEKVAYLLRRDQACQEAAGRLTQRVAALETGGEKRDDELRREVEARVGDEINAAKEAIEGCGSPGRSRSPSVSR